MSFGGLDRALTEPGTQLRLFGKPEVRGQRRMGVALALADEVESACNKACAVIDAIEVSL